MIHETDPGLDKEPGSVGCYVESIGAFDLEFTDDVVNRVWREGKAQGYISSALIVVNPQGIVDLYGYPLRFLDGHFPADYSFNPTAMHVIGEWHNASTGFTHFVVMDGKGSSRENVIYDPIPVHYDAAGLAHPGSKTVAEGVFVSYRLFEKVVA